MRPGALAESPSLTPSLTCFSAVLGFPATGAREPDPAGADQQAVPSPGQREPHRFLLQPKADGSRRQPAMGQPAKTCHLHLAQTQGLYHASPVA